MHILDRVCFAHYTTFAPNEVRAVCRYCRYSKTNSIPARTPSGPQTDTIDTGRTPRPPEKTFAVGPERPSENH